MLVAEALIAKVFQNPLDVKTNILIKEFPENQCHSALDFVVMQ